MLKSTEVYKSAVTRAKADPRVTEAIGTPINEGLFISGHSEAVGGSGKSDVSIPISGPKGKATIYAVANKSAGEWKFNKLVVRIEPTAETIDLGENEKQDEPAE